MISPRARRSKPGGRNTPMKLRISPRARSSSLTACPARCCAVGSAARERSSTWSWDRAAKMSCTGPSCMSRTIRCSSRSLVARRRREAARASASRGPVTVHHVRFHGEVLGQPQAVGPRRRLDVPRLDPLPELAIVVATGERRGVLLGLVLEDGEDLRPQFVLRERYQHLRFGDGPLLPRATVQPDLRWRDGAGAARLLHRPLARALSAVQTGRAPPD